MSLHEQIRKYTHDIDDERQSLRSSEESLLNQCGAAEERLKRAQTEITRYRRLEAAERGHLRDAEGQVGAVQRELEEAERLREEINRRCAELAERYTEMCREREQVQGLVREAGERIEAAQRGVREEQKSSDRLLHELNEVRDRLARLEGRLAEARRGALDAFLMQTAARIEQHLASEQGRQRRIALAENLKKARHEDPHVGSLCDQRDQLRILIQAATVPAVKALLIDALGQVESQLEKQFPGALEAEGLVAPLPPIEELYYLRDSGGKTHLLLPLTGAAWEAVETGDTGRSATAAMRVAWGIVQGLGLRPGDGEFRFGDGRCSFSGQFSTEILEMTERINVLMSESCTLSFVFAELPSDIREALEHEDAD